MFLIQYFQDFIAFNCTDFIFEEKRDMWEAIIDLHMFDIRTIRSHDVIGDIDNEIYFYVFYYSFLPILILFFLLLSQFGEILANV